jgi:hypothetical protein
MMRFAMAVTLTGAAATSSLARADHRGLGPNDFDPIAESYPLDRQQPVDSPGWEPSTRQFHLPHS